MRVRVVLLAVLSAAILGASCAADDPVGGLDSATVCAHAVAVDEAVTDLFHGLAIGRHTYDVGVEADAADILRASRAAVAATTGPWRTAFETVLGHFERYWSAVVPQSEPDPAEIILDNLAALPPDVGEPLVVVAATVASHCNDGLPPDLDDPAACSDPSPFADLIHCDLRNTDLRGADLRGALLQLADLRGVDLSGADLTGADLMDAQLEGADLTRTVMDNTDLRYTNLTTAVLAETSLRNANFLNADLPLDLRGLALEGARFGVTTLEGVDFRGSTLARANLTHANIAGAELTGVDLRGAYLTDTKIPEGDMRDVLLDGAFLPGINLQGADLRGASFTGAVMAGADLRGADLRDADFTDATMRYVDLAGADIGAADFTGVAWLSSTCADGTLSDDQPNGACPPEPID